MADAIDVPKKTCGNGVHYHSPDSVPVFHFVQKDGHHGIADLMTVMSWARDIYSRSVPAEEIYRELYVILPRGRSLVSCTLTFGGTDNEPKLRVIDTGPIHAVLYTVGLVG